LRPPHSRSWAGAGGQPGTRGDRVHPLGSVAVRVVAALVGLLSLWAGEAARAAGPDVGAVAVARSVDRGPVAVPAATPEAIRYHRTGLWLWFVGRAWSLGVPSLILFAGLSARIRRIAAGAGRPWLIVVATYAVIYLAAEFALQLPLRYYAGFVRPHEYGLSTQSFGRWLGDAFKGLAVEMVGGVLFLWVPYWLMARSPRRWWLYTGLLTLPFAGFSALIAPVWIDPLFNRFGPMQDRRLEAKIDALARRAGIDGGKIFEVDKSRDTRTVNAYVTGLWGTKRIVLWDTLLAGHDDDEVLAVLGHEMGHYALNHVALGLTLSSLATIAGLYAVHRASRPLIRRFGRRFGFDRIEDVASVPLLMVLIQGLVLLVAPASHALGRWMEHEADRFGLEVTRDNHAAASSFAKMQGDNLSLPYPDAFTRVWRSTHPPLGERIEFCNEYRPWESGRPTRYGHLFRDP